MDYKSVQFAIAIYVLQSFCVFYVFDKHIISHGRSILNTPYYLTVTFYIAFCSDVRYNVHIGMQSKGDE